MAVIIFDLLQYVFHYKIFLARYRKMTDKELRKRVKILKATDGIKCYREIAELMEMSNSSFYNWLNE